MLTGHGVALWAALSLLLAGALASGCAAPSRSATPASPPSTAAPTTAPAAGSMAPAGTDPATTVSLPAPCRPADLEASVDVQPPSASQPSDRQRALVVLTDQAGPSCRLGGFASVAVTRAGTETAVPAVHVDQPGSPVTVELAAGASAYAGVEWTSMPPCALATSLDIGLAGGQPAMAAGADAPGGATAPLHVCVTGFDVGPFEATAEGTVAFPDSVGAGLAACAASSLRGSMHVGVPSPAGAVRAEFDLANRGGRSCVTGGYVGLQLVAAGGHDLATRTVRIAAGVLSVELAAGQSAHAALAFATAASRTGCEAAAVATDVTPPGGAGQVRVHGPGMEVCQHGELQVGPLEAGGSAGTG